jgi:hypothetical protein
MTLFLAPPGTSDLWLSQERHNFCTSRYTCELQCQSVKQSPAWEAGSRSDGRMMTLLTKARCWFLVGTADDHPVETLRPWLRTVLRQVFRPELCMCHRQVPCSTKQLNALFKVSVGHCPFFEAVCVWCMFTTYRKLKLYWLCYKFCNFNICGNALIESGTSWILCQYDVLWAHCESNKGGVLHSVYYRFEPSAVCHCIVQPFVNLCVTKAYGGECLQVWSWVSAVEHSPWPAGDRQFVGCVCYWQGEFGWQPNDRGRSGRVI